MLLKLLDTCAVDGSDDAACAASCVQAYQHIYGGVVQLAWPRAVYRHVILGGRMPYLSQLLGRPLHQEHQQIASPDTSSLEASQNAGKIAGRLQAVEAPQGQCQQLQQQRRRLPQGMWGEGLSKAALEALVSLHLKEFDCSACNSEELQQCYRNGNCSSNSRVQRPFAVPGITEHDTAVYTVDYSVDADAYLLHPTGAAAAARSKSQQAWEALKAAAEENLLTLLQEAVPNIRDRLEVSKGPKPPATVRPTSYMQVTRVVAP